MEVKVHEIRSPNGELRRIILDFTDEVWIRDEAVKEYIHEHWPKAYERQIRKAVKYHVPEKVVTVNAWYLL